MTHDDEHDDDYAEQEHHQRRHRGGGRSWLKGFMIGGLVGLGISLLYAPQAGRDTRELMRYKATQLKQAAEQTAQDTKERVEQMSDEAKDQMHSMRQRGMEKMDETKSRVTRVANAVSQAAKESWEAEPTGTGQTNRPTTAS